MKLDPKKIYNKVKAHNQIYDEKEHCLMVLNIIGNGGTVAEFCLEAYISEKLFYKWRNTYPVFDECSRLASLYAQVMWEREGEENADNPDFNFRYWEGIGAQRYNYGRSARIRLNVDSSADPHTQYQQLIEQATGGQFCASEIKQLMESINIGIRAYESFKIQEQVDKMKEDIIKMNLHNGNNITAVKETQATD